MAFDRGHKEIVQFLIEKGIDINRGNIAGNNGLHLATHQGHIAIVQILIKKGNDWKRVIKVKKGKNVRNEREYWNWKQALRRW